MEIATHKNITGYQQTAVAYTRLSVEEAKEGESSSITNQKISFHDTVMTTTLNCLIYLQTTDIRVQILTDPILKK